MTERQAELLVNGHDHPHAKGHGLIAWGGLGVCRASLQQRKARALSKFSDARPAHGPTVVLIAWRPRGQQEGHPFGIFLGGAVEASEGLKPDKRMSRGSSSVLATMISKGSPDTLEMMRPRSAKPRFEYSEAVPGARAKCTPSRSSCENSSSGSSVCLSPQGSSETKPAVWLSKLRTRIRGESPVG